jgi:hypothetical protein
VNNAIEQGVNKSINDAREQYYYKNEWDYSAFEWAASSLVLTADDWTGYGVLDDIVIPLAYGAATVLFLYTNRENIWTGVTFIGNQAQNAWESIVSQLGRGNSKGERGWLQNLMELPIRVNI